MPDANGATPLPVTAISIIALIFGWWGLAVLNGDPTVLPGPWRVVPLALSGATRCKPERGPVHAAEVHPQVRPDRVARLTQCEILEICAGIKGKGAVVIVDDGAST